MLRASRACVALSLLRSEQIELAVGIFRALRARQFFEDRIQTHLRVVDLGNERIAFGLQCIARFAHEREFGMDCLVFLTQLRELLFERMACLLLALVDLDQPADIL